MNWQLNVLWTGNSMSYELAPQCLMNWHHRYRMSGTFITWANFSLICVPSHIIRTIVPSSLTYRYCCCWYHNACVVWHETLSNEPQRPLFSFQSSNLASQKSNKNSASSRWDQSAFCISRYRKHTCYKNVICHSENSRRWCYVIHYIRYTLR